MPATPTQDANARAQAVLEHLFRHEGAKVKAHLLRVFGVARLEMAEDAVQDALLKAMQAWPYGQIPDKPAAWLVRVAYNRMLDRLRREQLGFAFAEKMGGPLQVEPDELKLEEGLNDDRLRMIFACCHPAMPAESRLILTLKLVAGFSTGGTAHALLKKEEAITKAFTRAKQRMKDAGIRLEAPTGEALQPRLEAALQVIYLIFNEGYSASQGSLLIRKDLCEEAVFLCGLLLENTHTALPVTHALMALMLLQASRLDARTTADGNLLVLKEQDRSRWNMEMAGIGNQHLNMASQGRLISTYHLQAAIASCHALSPGWAQTNWPQIHKLYSMLLGVEANPIVALNRTVATSMLYGSKAALKELEELKDWGNIQQHHLYHAIKAELLIEEGENAAATDALIQALALCHNQAERQYLQLKLQKTKASGDHIFTS